MVSINAKGLVKKAGLGIGGIPGVIISTIVIELALQQIQNNFQPSQQILGRQIASSLPGLPGPVTVKDLGSLSPSITAILRGIKSKGKFNFKTIIANYGTKVLLRAQGINPLPDKNKNQLARKNFSYQLPMP